MILRPILRPVLRSPLRSVFDGGVGGGGGSPPLEPYLGIVATRGVVPNRKHATNTRTMSQTRHFARDDITALRLVYANWWTNGTTTIAEASPGAPMSVTATVSLDLTNWERVQFGGLDTGTVADGDTLESDALEIVIPAGSEFFIRTWKECTAGVTYCETYGDVANDEKFLIGTVTSDSTAGGEFSGNSNAFIGGPVAIVGTTTKRSALIIGDSITYGYGDTYTPSVSGDLGKIAPSIGASLGYIMAARNSDSAVDYVASNAKRTALAAYASHVVGAFGRNDLDKGRSAAQIQADIESIAAMFTIPVWWDTITPRSSSTDSWVTLENQTVAGSNTPRAVVNDWIRSGPAALAGAFDSCTALENNSASNEGRWSIPSMTTDGQHPSPAGYALVKSSGAIKPGAL